MGDRRMLTRKVTDDDHFMSLSASAQALYLHLSMSADDDGFCNQVALCMFKAHASVSDLEALLSLRYIYQFESGVIVIKHWRINNYLQKDRYTPTKYGEEKATLTLDENMAYREAKAFSESMYTQEVYTQDRLGKDRLGKDSIDSSPKRSRFVPPTLEEVKAYASENHLNVDADKFYRYFTTPNDKGETWVDSKGNKVKNWKQKMLTWDRADVKTGASQERAKSRNTMMNYVEKGVSHPRIEDIEMDIDDL